MGSIPLMPLMRSTPRFWMPAADRPSSRTGARIQNPGARRMSGMMDILRIHERFT